jgi:kynureninase
LQVSGDRELKSSVNSAELDRLDPLARFREQFVISDPGLTYLDGNSLGRMPKRAALDIKNAIDCQWGEHLIQSWGEDWYDLPQRLGQKIARLVGAKPDEVICCDSTSVNFYKLAHSMLSLRPERTKIVTDNLNFPSDLYILQGLCRQIQGLELIVVKSPDGIHIPPGLIEAEFDDRTALLTLSHVTFTSGFEHDLSRLSRSARAAGVQTLWDLSHSVGSVEIDLAHAEADAAVGCTYKYLNGGPGSPAFLYIRGELQDQLSNPISGWFGQRRPFDLRLEYEPAEGLNRMLTGTPPILSMVGVQAGVDLALEAGMAGIVEKSQRMYRFLCSLWQSDLAPLGIGWGSPEPDEPHGSHALLTHPNAYQIDQALIKNHRVIPDFRAPDGIRFGLSPLYTTFAEIERGVEALRQVLESSEWRNFEDEIGVVT